MFTGLIEQVGTLRRLDRRGGAGGRIVVSHADWGESLKHGESICVQGACLTVCAVEQGSFASDVLAETITRTSLGAKRPGAPLNLERALRPGDRLGGHMVSGHVDGLGEIAAIERDGADRVLRIRCDQEISRDVVTKGSIAVDGVSLTVAGVEKVGFTVHIIPTTWSETSFNALRCGDSVNLETDLIGKYVRRYMERSEQKAGTSLDDLASAGYLG